jgi:hypothetical protein
VQRIIHLKRSKSHRNKRPRSQSKDYSLHINLSHPVASTTQTAGSGDPNPNLAISFQIQPLPAAAELSQLSRGAQPKRIEGECIILACVRSLSFRHFSGTYVHHSTLFKEPL